MHPAEELWVRHHPPTGYPAGVLAVPSPIPGIAFFPGGFGLWRPDTSQPLPTFPRGGVMVLGHDFHSEAGYHASLARGREAETQPTWRNLRALLKTVGIAPIDCFFTNVYMGLRQGEATTGPFPGANDWSFVRHCETFLIEQLSALRPSLLVTLGINVPPILGRIVPGLSNWAAGRGLRHLDRTGPVRIGVQMPGTPAFISTVVALTHPSLWHASVRHRRYRAEVGAAAEVAMLREALTSIGELERAPRGQLTKP
jgi:hypothetical protein